MPKFVTMLFNVFLFVPALHGCSHVLTSTQTDNYANSFRAQPALKKTKYEKIKPFDEETLYQLLVADIALIRGQYPTALSKYISQAKYTRDEAVTEIAFGIAQYAQDGKSSYEMAALWLDINPQKNDAYRAMLQAYSILENALKALPYAAWLYKKEDDDSVFLAITTIAEGRKKSQIKPLIKAYREIDLPAEKKITSELAVAMLLREDGELVEAKKVIVNYITKRPDDVRGRQVLAQILHQQKQTEDAILVIQEALQSFPESQKLRLQYARLLTTVDRSKGLRQFELLQESTLHSEEVNFLLALLYIEDNKHEKAEKLLNQLTLSYRYSLDSHYYLGYIHDKTNNYERAIFNYKKVLEGSNFLAATSRVFELLIQTSSLVNAKNHLNILRSALPERSKELFELESNILIKIKQPANALKVLAEGIESHPDDADLLYARAMLAEQQGDFSLAESDLLKIISRDADNVSALNALGYTMLLNTDRLDEAFNFIKRAYILKPDSPAIIDSMGWALFKRGEMIEALDFLKRAMAKMPDPEIAAHLGEIYWTLGDEVKAIKTWNQGLKRVPNAVQIISTMKRLGISLQKRNDN
tara:strand:+ start:12993 stop:14753 length:1761 start_codon:yes stop_codon:yes gene_type:complete